MNLLFDLDGTLTNPFTGITACIRHALNKMGREAPAAEDLRWCIGPPLHESFQKLLDTTGHELADQALAHYRERFSSVGLFENEVYEGIDSCLAKLSADGHELRVATAKPTVYARRIMEHFGLGRYFVSINGSELDGTRTDKSELIRYLLRRDDIDPAGAVMIGDRGHDMIGARSNEVRAIGVLWGFGGRRELDEAGATCCVASPPELLSQLEKFAARVRDRD